MPKESISAATNDTVPAMDKPSDPHSSAATKRIPSEEVARRAMIMLGILLVVGRYQTLLVTDVDGIVGVLRLADVFDRLILQCSTMSTPDTSA